MTAIITNSVSISATGETTITCDSGTDFSKVRSSSVIYIHDISALLVLESGTAPVNGTSTLTLKEGYPSGLALPSGNKATVLIGYDALVEMAEDLAKNAKYASEKVPLLEEYFTTDNPAFTWTKLDGSTFTVRTPMNAEASFTAIEATANSLVNSLALTKESDFERNRILRVMDAQRVCSGFIETGLHNSESIVAGLYTHHAGATKANTIFLGRTRSDGAGIGDSKTEHPVIDVNGVEMHLNHINTASIYHSSELLLPEAVDPIVEATTTTAQAYNQHDCIVQGNDAYFCIADSTAGDLLTDTTKFRHEPNGAVREDLLGFEAVLVTLSGTGKRPFYPRGMVQNSESSYEGVTMSATSSLGISGVDAGYTKAGEWDSTTDGLGCDWESLTDAQRETLASNPENNVYVSGGIAYQWHLRYRAIRGYGCGWDRPAEIKENPYRTSLAFSHPDAYINPIGSQNGGNDFTSAAPIFYTTEHAFYDNDMKDVGVSSTGSGFAHSADGKCYFMPIALVTRLNKGAYHKFLNEWGTDRANKTDGWGGDWNDTSASPPVIEINDLATCFVQAVDTSTAGRPKNRNYNSVTELNISGRPDGGYYDAVEPWQVHSLRLLTHNPDKTVNGSQYEAVSNVVRGTQGMPVIARMEVLSIDQILDVDTANARMQIQFATPDVVNHDKTTIISGSAHGNSVNTLYGLPTSLIKYDFKDKVFGIIGGESCYLSFAANYSHGQWRRFSDDTVKQDLPSEPSDYIVYVVAESNVSVSGEYPTSCYFGLPERLKATMDKHNQEFVYGKWFPPIPDGTDQDFKILSDKVASNLGRVYTSNDGDTWASATGDSGDFIGTSNSVTQNWTADLLLVQSYTAYANGWEPESQSSVDNAELSDVAGSNSHLHNFGSVLSSHWFGEVPTGNTLPTITFGSKLKGYAYTSTDLLSQNANYTPAHETIDLGGTSTGFKCAFYHSTTDSRIKFAKSLVKQIKYDSALDNGAEFEDVSESTSKAYVNGNYYHITDGRFTGYWQSRISITTTLTSNQFHEREDGVIVDSAGTEFFERWDGNGWSDDDQLQVVDGLSIIESESPDIYVQLGHFTNKRPINAI